MCGSALLNSAFYTNFFSFSSQSKYRMKIIVITEIAYIHNKCIRTQRDSNKKRRKKLSTINCYFFPQCTLPLNSQSYTISTEKFYGRWSFILTAKQKQWNPIFRSKLFSLLLDTKIQRKAISARSAQHVHKWNGVKNALFSEKAAISHFHVQIQCAGVVYLC